MPYHIIVRTEGAVFNFHRDTVHEALSKVLEVLGKGAVDVKVKDPDGREWTGEDFEREFNERA